MVIVRQLVSGTGGAGSAAEALVHWWPAKLLRLAAAALGFQPSFSRRRRRFGGSPASLDPERLAERLDNALDRELAVP